MSASFNTEYLIAITLQGLESVKALRNELKLLRDDSAKPIDFNISLKTNAAQAMGKQVEQEVAKGLKNAMAGAKSGGTSGMTVGLDPAALKTLDATIGKFVSAVDAVAGKAKPIEVDVKGIEAAVARGVSEGLARMPAHAPVAQAATAERAIDRAAVSQRLKRADDLSGNIHKATVTDTGKIEQLLKERSELLGGALDAQLKAFRKQMQAEADKLRGSSNVLENSFAHGEFAKDTNALGMGVGVAADALMEETEELRQRYFEGLRTFMQDSRKQVMTLHKELSETLERGTERVTMGAGPAFGGDFSASFDRSMERLTTALGRSITEIGDAISQRIQSMVDVLARMPAQIVSAAPASEAWRQVEKIDERTGNLIPAAKAARKRQVNPKMLSAHQMFAPPYYALNNQVFEAATPAERTAAGQRVAAKAAVSAEVAAQREVAQQRKAEQTRRANLQKLVDSYSAQELQQIEQESRVGRVFFPNTRKGHALSGIGLTQQQIAGMLGGGAYGELTPGAAQGKGIRLDRTFVRRMANAQELAGLNNDAGVSMTFGQARFYSGMLGRAQSMFRRVENADPALLAMLRDPEAARVQVAREPNTNWDELDWKELPPAVQALKLHEGWGQLRQHPFVRQVLGDGALSPGYVQSAKGTAEGVRKQLTEALRLAGRHRQPGGRLPFVNGEYISPMHYDQLDEQGKRAIDSALKRGNEFYEFDEPANQVIADQMKAYEQALQAKGIKTKDREVLSARLDQLARLRSDGGEWVRGGPFNGFTFSHPSVSPGLQQSLQERLAQLVPGYVAPMGGDRTIVQDAVQFGQGKNRGRALHHNVAREEPIIAPEDRLASLHSELSAAQSMLGELPARIAAVEERLQGATGRLSQRYGDLDWGAFAQDSAARRARLRLGAGLLKPHDEYLTGVDPATGLKLTGAQRRAAAARVREALASARSNFGVSTPEGLRGILGGILPPDEQLETDVAARAKLQATVAELRAQERHAQGQAAALPHRIANYREDLAAGPVDLGVQLGPWPLNGPVPERIARAAETKRRLMDAYLARTAGTPAVAEVLAAATGAGGAGGNGGKGPPVAMGFGGSDEPEHVRKITAALTDLGHVQLDRLAGELASISASLKNMGKNGALTQLTTIEAWKQKSLSQIAAQKDANADRIDRTHASAVERERVRTEEIQKRQGARALLTQAMGGQSDLLVSAMAGSGGSGLSREALLYRFGRLASKNVSQEMGLEEALNLHNLGHGSAESVLGRGARLDATRASLFGLLGRASRTVPGFSSYSSAFRSYSGAATERMELEDIFDRYHTSTSAIRSGGLNPEMRRKAGAQARQAVVDANDKGITSEKDMVRALMERRQQERAVSASIMERATHELDAIKQTEAHVTLVERFGQKLKTLSVYAGAGFLLYSGAAKIGQEFGEARQFEMTMAQLQGLAGGNAQARAQLQGSIYDAARTYGANPLQVAQSARSLYPSFRGATGGALNDSLLAQRGLGFDEQNATQLLLAVHEQTGGRISGQDILDRLAKLENSHAVSANELAVVLQRTGQQAAQMQPTRGAQDAYSTLLGLSTHIMEQTRLSGEQTATVLRTVMSHLESPATQKQIQALGVPLGGSSPLELRSLMDILHDTAKTYKNLMTSGRTAQAADLAVQLGGTRQAPYVVALLNDFEKAERSAADSALAYGEANRRLITSLDTLDAQFSKLGATVFQFFNSFLTNSGLMWGLKALAGGSNSLLGQVANGFGSPIGADVMPGVAMAGAGFGLMGLQKFGKSFGGYFKGMGNKTIYNAVTGGFEEGGSALAGNAGTLLEGLGSSSVLGGISAFVVLLGAIAASAGVIKFLADEWEKFHHGTNYTGEVDVDKLKGTDQYKQYVGMAQQYGLDPKGLFQTVSAATSAARGDVAGMKRGPGYGEALEASTLKHLESSIPQLAAIADPNERRSVAMALLRGTYIQGTAVGSTASAGLSARFVDDAAAIASHMARANVGPVNPMMGSWSTIAHSRGMPVLKSELGRAIGGAFDGTPMAGLQTALQLVDVNGHALGNILGQIATLVKNGGVSVGAAFDKLADQFYTYGAGEEAVADQVGSVGRLRSGGYAHVAMVRQNRAQLDAVIAAGFNRTHDIAGNAQQAVAAQGDLTGAAAAGAVTPGSRFTDLVIGEMRKVAQRKLGEFRSKADTSGAADMRQTLDELSNTDFRKRMMAHVASTGRPNILRDRILEPLIRYGDTMMGLSAQDEVYGPGGLKIGGKFTEQQASATDEALKSLLGVKGAMAGDLARLENKASQMRNAPADMQFGEDGLPIVTGKDQAMVQGLAAVRQMAMRSPEYLAVQTDQRELEQAIAGLATSPVMRYLDPGTRQLIFSWMGGKKTPETYKQIIAAVSAQRAGLETKIQGERGSIFDVGAAGTTQLRLLQSSQAMQRLGLTTGQRFADIRGDVGASLGYQLSGVYQSHAFDAATIRQQAANQRASLDESARVGGSYGGPQYLEDVRQLEIQTREKLAESNDKLVQSLTELRDTLQLDVAQRRQAVVDALSSSASSGFVSVLGGGYSRIRQLHARDGSGVRQLGPALLDPITSTINERVSQNFVDSIVGKNGLLGGQMTKFFGKDAFQSGADLLYAAHVNGIVDGLIKGGVIQGSPSGSPTLGASNGGAGTSALVGGAVVAVGGGLLSMLPHRETVGAGQVSIGGIVTPAPHVASVSLGVPGAQSKWGRFGNMAAQLGGQIGGSFIGTELGVKGPQGNYSDLGSGVGSTIGSAFGPWGTLAGGVLGGFIGGRFGRSKAPPPEYAMLEKIEANTRAIPSAIVEQTKQLINLEAKYLNLPASFVFPRSYSVTGGSGVTTAGNPTFHITVNANTASGVTAEHVATAVTQAIQKQLGSAGTFSSIRR